MSDELNGRKIAILGAAGGEQVELERPRQAVEDPGAKGVQHAHDEGATA